MESIGKGLNDLTVYRNRGSSAETLPSSPSNTGRRECSRDGGAGRLPSETCPTGNECVVKGTRSIFRALSIEFQVPLEPTDTWIAKSFTWGLALIKVITRCENLLAHAPRKEGLTITAGDWALVEFENEFRLVVDNRTRFEKVGALLARTDAIYAESVANGDMRLALSTIREERGCLELLGKVTGEIHGPEHAADPRPMFSLPDGSYPRTTVEIPADDVRELPSGD